MKLGIMGAMPEEIDNIKELLSNVVVETLGGREYILGNLGETEVVLVFSRWGKVASGSTTTSLIVHFCVQKIIFTGVAGATSDSLNIGDIVISERLYQHDMDASPLMPKFEIPLTNTTFFEANKDLIDLVYRASNKTLESIIQTEKSTLDKFKIHHPKVIVGTIATGDQFISSIEKTKEIVSEQSSVVAVEMEGGAVAQVCSDYKIPFVVIRTISDKADHSAHIDFPSFIEKVAAVYSKYIVKNVSLSKM